MIKVRKPISEVNVKIFKNNNYLQTCKKNSMNLKTFYDAMCYEAICKEFQCKQ